MKLYFYSIDDNEKFEKVLHCQELEADERLKTYKVHDGCDFWPYKSVIKKDELDEVIKDAFGIKFGIILDSKNEEKARILLDNYVEKQISFFEKNIRYFKRCLKAAKFISG